MMNVFDGPSTHNWHGAIDEVLIDKNEIEDQAVMLNYATTIGTLNHMADEIIRKIQGKMRRNSVNSSREFRDTMAVLP